MPEIHEGVSLSETTTTRDPLIKRATADLADVVNDVIKLELAAAHALSSAAKVGTARELGDAARDLERAHHEQIAALSRLVEELGGEPVARGRWHEIVDVARVRLGERQGDRGIIEALATNERNLIERARSAIDTVGFVDAEREILAAALTAAEDHVQRLNHLR